MDASTLSHTVPMLINNSAVTSGPLAYKDLYIKCIITTNAWFI